VRYVLEDSVRKYGNRVRNIAQLIDVTIGSHVWAERYDREPANIFACRMRSPNGWSGQSSRSFMPPSASAASASLNPNFSLAQAYYGLALSYCGR
jgi:hypothetical protein